MKMTDERREILDWFAGKARNAPIKDTEAVVNDAEFMDAHPDRQQDLRWLLYHELVIQIKDYAAYNVPPDMRDNPSQFGRVRLYYLVSEAGFQEAA